jgi:two-component system OmpR family sensor kinase
VKLSFRARLTLRWVVAFGLVLALAHLTVYLATRAFLTRDLDAQLRTLAGTELASAVDEPGQGPHLHEIEVDAGNAGAYADKFVQLIAEQGQVLLQSPGLTARGSLVEGAHLAEAFRGEAPLFEVATGSRRGRMIALVTSGIPRYVVAVGLYTDKLDATLAQLRALLAGVGLAALGLTAMLGLSLASSALVPIRRITLQAAAIADGQFDTRLDPPVMDDEIGRMTRLLNEMLDRLHGAIEANRRFASDASHELRGPLTAMLGEIDVTLKRERSPNEYRDSLALLHERLQRMHALTDDLMLLVRAQERREALVTEVRVRSLLQRVVDGAADMAGAAGITVTLEAAADLVVYGDPGLLERVFDNLVRNGIQYNREQGSVSITARVDPSRGGWEADDVVIAVRDSGTGIPADDRERVFERFYRVDPSRSRRTGGTGLGLAIAREIVQLFKGTIRVADSSAAGTTIEVLLPGGQAPPS